MYARGGGGYQRSCCNTPPPTIYKNVGAAAFAGGHLEGIVGGGGSAAEVVPKVGRRARYPLLPHAVHLGRDLLQMQDLHFAKNDICIAARLANLRPESTSQQTTFV